jgi:hypothetical protein
MFSLLALVVKFVTCPSKNVMFVDFFQDKKVFFIDFSNFGGDDLEIVIRQAESAGGRCGLSACHGCLYKGATVRATSARVFDKTNEVNG